MKLFDPKLTGSIEIQSEVSGSLIPTTTEVFDLGSPTARWRDIYLSGSTIDLGGTKITTDASGDISFQDGSGNAKKIKVEEILVGSGNNQKRIKIDDGKLSMVDRDGNPDTQMVGHMMPHGHNQYDLGSPTAQWRDLYLSSASLYIDGTQVLSSDSNVLTITTDTGQSLKLLETGADDITLQTDTGNIELKGTVEILSGKRIIDSAGSVIQFGDNIGITGSIEVSGTVDGIDLQAMSSSLASRISSLDNEYATDAQLNAVSASVKSFATSADTTLSSSLAADIKTNDGRLDTLEGKTLISQSAQIASDISGSNTAFSASVASRFEGLTTNYNELDNIPANIVSGSTQIRDFGAVMDNEVTDLSLIKGLTDTKISGSFTATSASIATNIATNTSNISTNASSITSLNAATSSYLQNTTDTLTGNLTVTGTLTAQQFNTEYVSASILFDSGSTKFGDSSDDTHSFTGSVYIQGNYLNVIHPSPTIQLQDTSDDDDQKIRFLNNGGSIEYVIQTQDFTSGGGGDGLSIGSVSSDPVRFATANTTAVTIDTSQNVGIGTASPDAKLDIYDNVNRTSIHVQNSNHIAKFEAWGTATAIDTSASNGVFIRNGGTNHVHFDGNGRVGVNVTDPSTQFHVSGSGEVIRLQGATGQSYMTFFQGTGGRVGYIGTSGTGMILESADYLRLYTSGSDAVYITGDNKVGIGNSNPSYPLSVTGAISGSTYYGDASNLTGRIGLATSASHAEYADNATSATSATSAGSATSASSVPYSGLTGTVPTWNQNTTGNAATATSASFATNATTSSYALTAASVAGTIQNAQSASHAEYADNAGTLDSLDSSQFLRSDTGDTMTGLLTFRGTTAANNSLIRLGAGGASSSYTTVDIVKTADTSGDMVFMAYHAGEAYSTSSPKIIFGHYDGTPINGHVLTVDTNAKNVGIGTTSPSAKLHINDGSLQFDKTNTSSGGDFDFIKMGYNGSWSQNQGGIAGISVDDATGVVGRYGITYGAGGGRFVVTDLYDGGYANSGDVFYVRGDGDAYIQGSLGIGTTSPSNKLDVAGGAEFNGETYIRSQSNVGLRIQTLDQGVTSNDGVRVGLNGSHGFVWQYENLPLAFATSGSERMTISSTGNVGIGSTNPAYKLDVNGSARVGNYLTFTAGSSIPAAAISYHTNGYLYLKGGGGGIAIGDDSYSSSIYCIDNGNIEFNTQGATKMVINTSGNVGIGTTSPGTKFHVVGAAVDNESLGLFTNNYSSGGVFFPALKAVNTHSNHSYGTVAEFRTEAGSGTDRPSILFSNAHTAHNWTVGQGGYTATDNFSISYRNFHPNTAGGWGTPRFVIDTAGKVGIGTHVPSYSLDVVGNIRTKSTINVDRGGISSTASTLAETRTINAFSYNTLRNGSTTGFFLAPVDTNVPGIQVVDSSNNAQNLAIQPYGGKVGIGNKAPTRTLHVSGDIEGTIFRDGSYYLDPSSNSVLAGNLTVGTNLTVYGDTTLGNSQDDNTVIYGNLSGVLNNSGEGLSKIEGFIAEIGAENGENQFILPGSTQNELAGATERFTVAATLNGNATSLASAVFKSTHHYQNISVSTNDTVVITITNASFSHSSGVGIVFSSRAWRARNITIETTTDGTNWTSRGSVTNYAYSSYYVTFSTGGTATTGIRYTLTNFNTTSTRIAHLFANNYAGGEAYHVDKWYADTKYNELSIDSSGQTDNYYLRFKEGGSDRFTIYENGNNVYFNGTAGHTIFRPQISGGGSFAVYGGNTQFDTSGNGTLAGNLTVAGTITAQQFHTEYVSSSILHESGSTSFGNSSDDVHNFTGSVNVQGNVSHEGLTMTDGTDIDQIKTFSKSLTITTSWLDTGIKATDLATGTYMVQLHTNNHGVGGGHYDERYSGIMSWYAGSPNSTDSDEIVLHKAGHASNGAHIYLRTIRTTGSDTDDLKLQIASTNTTSGNSTYTFKFRRMI